EGLTLVRDQLDGGFSQALEKLGACRGRVVVSGIGKSGLVGRKIAATLSSTGTPSFFLHPVEGAHGDMGMLRAEDVILAISNSGETDELNAILPAMRSLGATIVGITGGEDSTLAMLSDVIIPVRVEREACPLGLAPTASTTAILAVGDALAVCLMRKNGFDQKDFKRFHPGGSLGARLSLSVIEFMHTDALPVVDATAPLSGALDALNDGGFGLVVILGADNKVLGVISDGDVRRMVCSGPLDPTRPAVEVMTAKPRTAIVSEPSSRVLDIMEAHQITVLPVVAEDGLFQGLIHLHDLLGKGRLKFSAH
ncbi:MAG: KpsF/GutQ family sugar-phosphate isomerase, partial [Proteobacteria bacterium]|nr:KpsF/GutQ family sugar-phosphate isomerase [Pseudomonadota bacterium]